MVANGTNVVMENVRLVFRNFEGKEGRYNRKGDRSFNIVLDEETARRMEADGWNVKWFKDREDREDGDPREGYLELAMRYDRGRPPKVVIISNITGKRNFLDEDTVEMLDWAEFVTVDVVFRARYWEVNEKSGIKAYLQSMYATIVEDPLDAKYNNQSPVDEEP